MIPTQQNTSAEMSLDQMIRHVTGTLDMRGAIIEQIKSIVGPCRITTEEIFGPVVKKPFLFYCEDIEAGWTKSGQKPKAFGSRSPKDYPIQDEDAFRIAQKAKRDVMTVSGKLVKYTATIA